MTAERRGGIWLLAPISEDNFVVLLIAGPLFGAYFVTSDKPDPRTQRSEMTGWAETHGYRPDERNFVYTIYQGGEPVREWRLVSSLLN